MVQPFRIVAPLEVTEASIVATNVDEDYLYPEYNPSTTYALGNRVRLSVSHSVYESVYDGSNTGHTPNEAASAAYWARVGPTNKFKMFDSSPSTSTVANGTSFYMSFKLYSFISVASLLNLRGVLAVNVTLVSAASVELYNRTIQTGSAPLVGGSWWHFFFGQRSTPSQALFTDIPFDPSATLTVTVTGAANCSVGTLILGQPLTFGIGASYGSEVGFTDYSRKEVSDFGDTILVERPYADRATFEVEVAKDETDSALLYLKTLRATPFLAIGTDEYESTTLYCYVQDARVSFQYPDYNVFTVELTGMT